MRYVMCFGELFQMTEANYRKMLQRLAAKEEIYFSDFGKSLTGNVTNVTDMTAEQAQELLDMETKRKDQERLSDR